MPNAELPSGTDVRILMQNCQSPETLLRNPDEASSKIREAITRVGFHALSEVSHSFDGDGYTLAIVLAESHLVVHTWPEYDQLVLIDLSVCNYLRPNRERTLRLKDQLVACFSPDHYYHEEQPMVPRLMNTQADSHGTYLDLSRIVDSRSSLTRSVLLAESRRFGKTLCVDGMVQSSEIDSAYYHESLAHVVLLSHENPKRVLIVGGDHGQTASEVLKHPGVESCDLVVANPDVMEMASRLCSGNIRKVFSDSRVTLTTSNIADFLHSCPTDYDCILFDPLNPVCPEYPEEVLSSAFSLCASGGILSVVLGDPYHHADATTKTGLCLNQFAARTDVYCAFAPTLGTSLAVMLCGPEPFSVPDEETIGQRMVSRELHSLVAVSPETMRAWFAIPPKIRKQLGVLDKNRTPAATR